MKIALCLYGLVGSTVGKNGEGVNLDPKLAFDLYKKHIIDCNDEVDIFIHSWSVKEREKLIELYQPKNYIIESSKEFKTSENHPEVISLKRNLIKKTIRNKKFHSDINKKKLESYRAHSRWYSNKKVLELKREHEEKNNFVYDFVMVSRLDVGFFTNLNFDQFNNEYFYASNWNDYPTEENNYTMNKKNHYIGKGFLDFWFFSNSKNMDDFGQLFDKIYSYSVSPHFSSREHVHTITDKVKFVLYRWQDHEMIRRKLFKSKI